MTFAPAVAPGWLRRNRWALGLGAALLLLLALLAALTSRGPSSPLDPDAYDPSGSHAVSALLQDRGVRVRRTTDLPATMALAEDSSTVFVPFPQELSPEELHALAELPGELIVAGIDGSQLQDLDDSIEAGDALGVHARDPKCAFGVASRAGRVDLGGPVYRGGAPGCYDGTLLDLPSHHLLLLGDASLMRNDHLLREGNAALSIGLLGRSTTLLWLIPDPNRPAMGTRPVRSAGELLPAWVGAAALQLLIALVLLAAWRVRRLGRVVPEPLPVVVRAAETIEGRGRMYRAARARDTGANELRAGARRRLGPRVGAGRNPSPDALVARVAGHTGRTADEVNALLYGPQPADDAALVRLADELDALTKEVTGS